MNSEILISTGMHLYRYDMQCPPSEWCSDYKSLEYIYPGDGAKNKVGAFFFFDNKMNCVLTAKHSRQYTPGYPIWLTECVLNEDVRLLDLRSQNVISMLDILYDAGIDVLTGNFVRHNVFGSSKPYSVLREFYKSIKAPQSENEYKRAVDIIQSFWGENPRRKGGDYSILGQQLTNFDNGIEFKRLLLEKGYEGYCFYEGCYDDTPKVTTYCIFNSEKFRKPITNVYSYSNMEEQDFINRIYDKLAELHAKRLEDEIDAGVALKFMKEFKPKLKELLTKNTERRVVFTRSMIVPEPCNYEIRQCMDGETINEVAHMGYCYIAEESTSKMLVFEKME